MPSPEPNHLRQFLLLVFALLIPCFSLWSFFSASLVTPVIGLAHLALSAWFPDIVNILYQQGADAVLLTHFDQVDGQLVVAANIDEGIGFKEDTRTLSYSIAFYATLHFATARERYLSTFLWGLLVLYPFIFLGLICSFLKNFMVTFGGNFLEQPGVPPADLIGIAYQFNVLIVPSLLPVLMWAWQNREAPFLRELLRTADVNLGQQPKSNKNADKLTGRN